eukprot:3727256-Rhodomonas_salina.2
MQCSECGCARNDDDVAFCSLECAQKHTEKYVSSDGASEAAEKELPKQCNLICCNNMCLCGISFCTDNCLVDFAYSSNAGDPAYDL